jgi:hypothetical protein
MYLKDHKRGGATWWYQGTSSRCQVEQKGLEISMLGGSNFSLPPLVMCHMIFSHHCAHANHIITWLVLCSNTNDSRTYQIPQECGGEWEWAETDMLTIEPRDTQCVRGEFSKFQAPAKYRHKLYVQRLKLKKSPCFLQALEDFWENQASVCSRGCRSLVSSNLQRIFFTFHSRKSLSRRAFEYDTHIAMTQARCCQLCLSSSSCNHLVYRHTLLM